MEKIAAHIKKGGVAVVPTDTLYGIVADAHNPAAVEEVYRLKKRDLGKACIVLIEHISQIEAFGCASNELVDKLQLLWPGPVTVVIPVADSGQAVHIHRGLTSIAFRMPEKNTYIAELLQKTGPLIAPSANIEGESPARNIAEAKNFFGGHVMYHDAGLIQNTKPSTIISFNEYGEKAIIRP